MSTGYQKIIDSVMRSSDIAMRKDLEVAVPIMNFNILANLCLSTDDIINESLNTLIYVYEYLNSLTVNSEGSRIDKGEEIDFNNSTNNSTDEAIVHTKVITPRELYDYEVDHSQRMNFFRTSPKIIISLTIIGSLFMVMDIWFMAVIIFVIVLLLMMLSYFNISTVNIGKLLNDTLLLKQLII